MVASYAPDLPRDKAPARPKGVFESMMFSDLAKKLSGEQ